MAGVASRQSADSVLTPERWRQVEELFHAALSRGESVTARPFWRTRAPATWRYRREVEALLAQPGVGPVGFLDGPAVAVAAETHQRRRWARC